MHQQFFQSKPGKRMKKEISCITSKGKMTKKEWENDDSDFL